MSAKKRKKKVYGMIWKRSPLKCYNDKSLLAVFQTCEAGSVCERATETGNVKRRRGDSYTSLSLLFSSVNLEKIFSLSDLRERRDEEEGGERETMKSRETHMERQHRERK